MSDRVTVDPIMQKDGGDCAVACLAMFLGVGYAEVRKVVHRKVGQDGLTDRQIINAAKKFGRTLRLVGEWEDTIGILKVERPVHDAPKTIEYHVVMFINGVVYNPADGLIWESVEALKAHRRWSPVGVFIEGEE